MWLSELRNVQKMNDYPFRTDPGCKYDPCFTWRVYLDGRSEGIMLQGDDSDETLGVWRVTHARINLFVCVDLLTSDTC